MATKTPAVVLGQGRRLSLGLPTTSLLPTAEAEAAVLAGAIPVTVGAFVEFDAGQGLHRWTISSGYAVIQPDEDHTSALIRAAQAELDGNDYPVAELGINGFRVSRWQAAAAPYRLELDPELAERLTVT